MFSRKVDRFVRRHCLLEEGAFIVVGVSGGPDSMALLDYLDSRRRRWKLHLTVATVDHRLRGEASKKDVAYVVDFCRSRGIAVESCTVDVYRQQKEEGQSVQQAARTLRYRFYQDVMKKAGADVLALGHHGDDLVETMLMRQVRGSYGKARAGMAPVRPFAGGRLIRPLLVCSKEEIETYLQSRGISPRRDPSNDLDDYTRNRFRHHVLPFLKKENPAVHLRYLYESETLMEDEQYLEEQARENLANVVVKKKPRAWTVSLPALARFPASLQRRMIHLILKYLYHDRPSALSSVHIENFFRLKDSRRPSGKLDFPCGLQVVRSYDEVLFSFNGERKFFPYAYRLTSGKKIFLPVGTIKAELSTYDGKTKTEKHQLVCDVDQLVFPLVVRSRKPGDRIKPVGMKGTKKVKDIFIDEKVPRRARDAWPLVVDGNGKILWLCGLKSAQVPAVNEKTKRVLIIHFNPVSTDVGGFGS